MNYSSQSSYPILSHTNASSPLTRHAPCMPESVCTCYLGPRHTTHMYTAFIKKKWMHHSIIHCNYKIKLNYYTTDNNHKQTNKQTNKSRTIANSIFSCVWLENFYHIQKCTSYFYLNLTAPPQICESSQVEC